jgi:hypothetical protein
MTLEQVAEMKLVYQKQKGHENLVLTPRVTFKITRTKLLASLTYPLKTTKISPPCLPNMSATYSLSTSDSTSGSAGVLGTVDAGGT